MEEYTGLIKYGLILVFVIIIGIVLRKYGIRYIAPEDPNKAKGSGQKNGARKRSAAGKKNGKTNGKGAGKNGEEEEETYFQQDAYVHDGGGPTEFEDDNLYAMKEGKRRKKKRFFDGGVKVKEEDKYESWDDY